MALMHDIRYSLRLLRKSPGFAVVALLALALGIGANTAIFSVVDSILLRPLPYREPGRMVAIWQHSLAEGWNRIPVSGPNFVDWREQSRSFADMAALESGTGTITGFGEPQQLPGLRASNSLLRMLGVRPMLGRDFTPQEGWGDRVSILSYSAWQRLLGGDPKVIGRKVIADGLVYTIIGVLPKDFWLPVAADCIVPWNDRDLRQNENRVNHRFGVLARLKPGVSIEQANADLNAVETHIAESFPRMRGFGVTVVQMQEMLVEYARPALLLLLGSVGLVLLIACANLANLMLARAAARQKEVSIRAALGAGSRRLLRQFLTESSVLGVCGGVLGLLLALWGVDVLQHTIPATIRLPDVGAEIVRPHIGMDWRVLAFTLGISLITGLIFGLAPAVAASRADVSEALKEGGRSVSAGHRRLRAGLVIAEVALALVLLICAGLSMKSFWHLQQVRPGFLAEHVLAMETELPTDSKYRTRREQADFFDRVLANLREIPGTRSAGLACVLPLDPTGNDRAEFAIEGRPPSANRQIFGSDFRSISAGYFGTLGIPLRDGRDFTDADRDGNPLVAIVDESFVQRFFTGEFAVNPIGQKVRVRDQARQIVGVVGSVKQSGLDKQPAPTIYVPFRQVPEARMSLVVRTAGDPLNLVKAVKRAVYAVDRDQPVYKIRSMDQALSSSQSSPRVTLLLMLLFAVAALLLASVGIYGVISYSVAQRTRELGIRVALGAGSGHVLKMVVSQGLALTAVGAALGLAAALAVTRLLSSLLFGVGARDPLVFGGTTAVLVAVALLASYLPARRAARTDPMVSLRYQ